MRRIPQPPVDASQRALEQHRFWPGFLVALLGAFLILGGLGHVTRIETVDGASTWETQLVKAFSSGGLQYPKATLAPPAPKPGDPAATAAALERWAQAQAQATESPWKVRVDTAAATPCPT